MTSTANPEVSQTIAVGVTPAMTWNDSYLLGFAAMDDTHHDFVACVAAMQTASDADLPARLADFARHAVAHFEQEKQWMQSTAFPGMECHVDEHAAVLASVREVEQIIQDGTRLQVARDLTKALVDWFPGHADHMDSALSHWISQKAHGGAPVVLKRNVAQAQTNSFI
ncbi:MAG: hemerythrin domain-containing protein [Burkholderiaceae bacterium]|nr:hemerythrin domain-containing protein [Burkholderiaceae bacterium]